MIDPGDDPTELRLELARMGTRPAGILVTHTDVDHIGGVAALADGTGAEVWAPAGEVEALRTGETRGGMRVAAARAGAHRHGRRRDHRRRHHIRGGRRARPLRRARRLPSRTASSSPATCSSPARSGASTSTGGDWETLLASVRALLERFPPETVVYPGHGPATTLGRELQTNPFLRELRAEPQA